MKLLTCVVTLLGLCAAASPVLRAEDLFVRANLSTGARTGVDWTNARAMGQGPGRA